MSEFYEPLDSVDKWDKRARDLEAQGLLDQTPEADHPILKFLEIAELISEHGRRITEKQEGEK
jgi:hypothetical protein